MDIFIGSKGEIINCGGMTAPDIIAMVNHYKPKEFTKVLNEAMESAFYDKALIEDETGYFASFVIPQSQVL